MRAESRLVPAGTRAIALATSHAEERAAMDEEDFAGVVLRGRVVAVLEVDQRLLRQRLLRFGRLRQPPALQRADLFRVSAEAQREGQIAAVLEIGPQRVKPAGD